MPKVSEMIVSKYLRKEDAEDELLLSIKDVAEEMMPGDVAEKRWVLYFRELPKALVLNATTIRVLEKAFGPHSDDWRGKKVTLYVDESVQFKGQLVGGLRVRPFKVAVKPKATATSALVPTEAELDDKLP